jgi:hypothetical protein
MLLTPNGTQEIYLDAEGRLHRDDGPAIVTPGPDYCAIQFYTEERYYYHGQLHRTGAPAIVRHRLADSIIEFNRPHEKWYHMGKLHRLDGPAIVNEDVMRNKYYRDGELHRVDGPAVIRFNYDTEFDEEMWYLNGKLHRTDGPAVTVRDNQTIKHQTWYQSGLKHRADGPAEIYKYNEHWYLNGMRHREDGYAYNSRYYLFDCVVSERHLVAMQRLRVASIAAYFPIHSSGTEYFDVNPLMKLIKNYLYGDVHATSPRRAKAKSRAITAGTLHEFFQST